MTRVFRRWGNGGIVVRHVDHVRARRLFHADQAAVGLDRGLAILGSGSALRKIFEVKMSSLRRSTRRSGEGQCIMIDILVSGTIPSMCRS